MKQSGAFNRNSRSIVHFLGALSSVVVFAGCLLLNDVNPVTIKSSHEPMPRADRAIVVYGIGVEGKSHYPGIGIGLDEYSIERQSITGDCWRFNRMQASVAAIAGTRQYFAFDVQPGHYVYSGFNGVRLRDREETLAFEVPAGRLVYLGDFVYGDDGQVDLRRDFNGVPSYFNQKIILANALSASPPKLFLCMP